MIDRNGKIVNRIDNNEEIINKNMNKKIEEIIKELITKTREGVLEWNAVDLTLSTRVNDNTIVVYCSSAISDKGDISEFYYFYIKNKYNIIIYEIQCTFDYDEAIVAIVKELFDVALYAWSMANQDVTLERLLTDLRNKI